MEDSSTDGGKRKCECGCGEVVSPTARFRPGHHRRKHPRHLEVDTGHDTPCRIWQLAISPGGYGLEHVPGCGPMVHAHRRSYELEYGPIPPGLQIDHLCREKACVNPDHLEAVTPRENVRRGMATKLTASDVREIRDSDEPQTVLADRYGISQPHVSRIKSYLTWRSE